MEILIRFDGKMIGDDDKEVSASSSGYRRFLRIVPMAAMGQHPESHAHCAYIDDNVEREVFDRVTMKMIMDLVRTTTPHHHHP